MFDGFASLVELTSSHVDHHIRWRENVCSPRPGTKQLQLVDCELEKPGMRPLAAKGVCVEGESTIDVCLQAASKLADIAEMAAKQCSFTLTSWCPLVRHRAPNICQFDTRIPE